MRNAMIRILYRWIVLWLDAVRLLIGLHVLQTETTLLEFSKGHRPFVFFIAKFYQSNLTPIFLSLLLHFLCQFLLWSILLYLCIFLKISNHCFLSWEINKWNEIRSNSIWKQPHVTSLACYLACPAKLCPFDIGDEFGWLFWFIFMNSFRSLRKKT